MAAKLSQELLQRAVWEDVEAVPFAVLGLGRSGLAAANALARRGADVAVYDDRSADAVQAIAEKLLPGVAKRFGGGYVARPGEICVVSPGIAPHTPTFRKAQASAARVIGEVELFYRLNRAQNGGLGNPIIAISGTDGKTTTAMMIDHLLRAGGHDTCLAGNIGTPLCEVLDQLAPSGWVVAEVSAFQLATCSLFRPRIAVLTNVADDHHDWFSGDERAYADAKRAVARQCGRGDTVVYNAADPAFRRDLLPTSGATLIDFSAAERTPALWSASATALHVRVADKTVDWCQRDAIGADAGAVLIGEHNAANALAAAAAVTACGVPLAAVVAGLRTFQPAPHRLQRLRSVGGVAFIDDSKATNPHAALAGLKAVQVSVDEKLVWIGGGSDKQADFTSLGAELGERGAAAVLIGATREQIAAAMPPEVAVSHCESMHEAVGAAFSLAQPGGTVLLSPACASFGLFRSYSHRGEVFQDAVRALSAAIG